MIRILTTAAHVYTHVAVAAALPTVRLQSYERALRARSLPAGTYIFTDLDRLGFWELELAADLFRLLRDAGCRVLNDPARIPHRAGLLHRLHASGLNRFAVWRAEDGALPDRFPVFLRTASAHRGVLTKLLHDEASAAAALEHALADGYPLRDLLFVEYCAAPSAEGTFWKHTVYRIGPALVPGPSVLDTSWIAKFGVKGLAREEDFLFERDLVRDASFVDMIRPALDAAAIDYGRADFTIVAGEPAIYEINTNPDVPLPIGHASPARAETLMLTRTRYLEALGALDGADGRRKVRLDTSRFERGITRYRFRRRLCAP